MQTYKGVFEAHITIKSIHTEDFSVFQSFCAENNLKPIQIELARGDFALQQMTSSVHEGIFGGVLEEVKEIATRLGRQGFEVVRLKIEASPFNEGLPAHNAEVADHPAENYFEHHLKLALADFASVASLLETVCQKYEAHISRNAFKKTENGIEERFVTVRHYGLGRQEAEEALQKLADDLTQNGFEILKSVTEYCVYDDFVNLDANWLTSTPKFTQNV